ncbi:ABATE domain-containing protein [Occultella aeris]|uniref:CGNR zinc finger n=1 Tax=Occultella aeris TaxID=2761496 RepID=A0A7M4DG74_9MICO|nr:CGNR zinc finger domain-containing protein [Occultella aeris]VZO35917.1 CGNR zinc finger [Occultella aeris]
MHVAENGFDTWAPPAAALVRDFVNSYEPQEDAESLTSVAALTDWLSAHGLVAPGASMTPTDLRSALRIREGLRAVLLAHAGHEAAPDARRLLAAELARLPLRAVLDDDGGLVLTGTGSDYVRAMAGLVDAIRRCEVARDWTRLKACARRTCHWAFYDSSRNHARRWCSMAGCGNYVKMRRRATSRTGADRTEGASRAR